MAVQGASENGLLLISDGTARRLSARIALNRAIFTTSRPGGAPEFERAPSRADRGRATGSDGPRSPLCRPGRPKHGHGAAGRGTGREEPDAGPTNVMVGSGAAMAPQNPELVIIMEATELSSVIRVNNTAQQRPELRESERGSVQRSTTCVAAPRSPDLHLLRGLRNGKPFPHPQTHQGTQQAAITVSRNCIARKPCGPSCSFGPLAAAPPGPRRSGLHGPPEPANGALATRTKREESGCLRGVPRKCAEGAKLGQDAG